MFKKSRKHNPIISFILLTFSVILLSGVLRLFNVQAEYSTVSKVTNGLLNNVIEVKNLFCLSGIKAIFTNTVECFIHFEPLASFIIVLIGIGVLDKSGFLETVFTILTKNMKKNTLTFIMILICLVFSLLGNIGYAIMIPLAALLFKYGRRNPHIGIIASFAALTFGRGINVFLNATDSSLLVYTLKAAKLIDVNYSISSYFSLYIMMFTLVTVAVIFTLVTEKVVAPKFPRIEYDNEDVTITNKQLRGLIVGLGLGLIYFFIIIYSIIPGLPGSGALLDRNAIRYIDKLFGANSLFNQGFIFIITIYFVIIGLGYGFFSRTIRKSKDISEALAYSLDGIGNVMVMMFFASLLLNVYELSNIGQVITAFLTNIIGSFNLTGVPLILLTFLLMAISTIFCPSSISKWAIMSTSIVPLFMNASITPEFTQIVFSAANSVTVGLTPLFAYFVIYIAMLEKYNKENELISIGDCLKNILPYALYIIVIWCVILVAWYMMGLPLGVSSLPGVIYGA